HIKGPLEATALHLVLTHAANPSATRFHANVRLTRHSRAQQNRQQKTLTKDYLLQQAIEICRCRVLKNVVNAARHDAITIDSWATNTREKQRKLASIS
ncbi:MAG: hypothetical protein EB015_11520, partial [Methylocystaceae bacterium]|nr:hypothetical protein [Methylocystaceae bacterium]